MDICLTWASPGWPEHGFAAARLCVMVSATVLCNLNCYGLRPGVWHHEAFERIFEKPTKLFNPFDHIQVSSAIDPDLLSCNAPQLVVATGLAARLARAS